LDAAADPNLSEGNLWTPLMFAILRNSSHIVELLLDYGATVNSFSPSPISSQPSGPESPLQLLKMLREEEEAEHRVIVHPEIVDMIRYVSHSEIESMLLIGTELKRRSEERFQRLFGSNRRSSRPLSPQISLHVAPSAPGTAPSHPPAASQRLRHNLAVSKDSTNDSSSSNHPYESRTELNPPFAALSSQSRSLWSLLLSWTWLFSS
jgi:hypothetical protein